MRKAVRNYGGAALAARVLERYQMGQTDYFQPPIVLTGDDGKPVGCVEDGDSVIFCCRRGEREIQLAEAFTEADWTHFPRRSFPNLSFVIMTLYHEKFIHLPVAFAPEPVAHTLAEAVSRAGLRQLHIAESEKFAHITYFLNGGKHSPPWGEVDVCIPSPTGIAFDRVPELSLNQVADGVIEGMEQSYDFIATNFANGDVIGHTDNSDAKLQCAERVDFHLGRVIRAGLERGYVMAITADHGNLEEMLRPDGSPHVAHTANPVPFLLLDPLAEQPVMLRGGRLNSVAPTLLRALDVPLPDGMDGDDLAPHHNWQTRRKLALIILDGWGMGKHDETNPIFLAETPVWDDLLARCGCAYLQASGEAVGLKPGNPGNSEAGHTNIGAGRVIEQDDTRLARSLEDGSFYQNPVLCQAITHAQERGSSLHLICLLSEKSSHGSIDYPLALIRMANNAGLENVFLHVIFDGRSTAPNSAPALLLKLDTRLAEAGGGQIASGVGRAFALDRGGNYARTRLAYDAMVFGIEGMIP